MISEYNLKALVFDDRENEAKPLIDALNYERIPNIYINFKDDSRDDKKVQNIRIVFADLIIGEYTGGEPKDVVEGIRASILDNISENNGPFILVVWSKHSEWAEVLSSRILEINKNLNFITICLDKHNYFEKDGELWNLKEDITFNNIRIDISSKLKEVEHLEIFFEWEKDARNTISEILNDFLDDISDINKTKDIVSSTIKSTLGEMELTTPKEKLDSFYYTLNSTLSDSIENNITLENKHEHFLNGLDFETINGDVKGLINQKTLFEKCNDDKTLKTGNIYCFNDFKELFTEEIMKDICGYDIDNIFDNNFFKHNPEDRICDETNDVLDRSCKTFSTSIEEGRLLNKKPFYRKCKSFSKENVHPILMEFTPSCDIANNKYSKSRLIFGYLFDSRIKCTINKSESVFMTDFHIKYKNPEKALDSNYRLVFFIKHIFAINPIKIKELTPMLRARKEFATDLQHSIANHVSRIGISSLDGFS